MQERQFKTALYARLSVKDDAVAHSSSIISQTDFLKDYLSGKREFCLCGTFVDDGYSGTSFDRPGFETMMQGIKSRRIDCVVVKDLSRLGRSYYETGELIENTFPSLGVRFISVNEQYDTYKTKELLPIQIKNILNDVYAKDIRRKVISVIRLKQEKGEFLGSYAPYGYIKDGGRLLPDFEVASVICQIFESRATGEGISAIAASLTRQGVMPPCRYRYEIGILKDTKFASADRWHPSAVRRILDNPIYIGELAQGKTIKPSIKVRTNAALKDQHIHKDKVLPLISEQLWQKSRRVCDLKEK